jgi:DNA modification methylase
MTLRLFIQVDARRIPLADQSVHCVVTSPPYFGLRDYKVAGQIGLEPTPDEYVRAMVQVFREVWRVLRDDGTLFLNIGDSYAGSGRGGTPETSPYFGKMAMNVCSAGLGNKETHGLKPKDLIGIPWLLAFALRADGWYLRQDIIWHKPNPMPESVRDRCTKSHEYVFLLTKSARYFYDAEAVKVPAIYAHRNDSRSRGSFAGKTNAMPGREAFRSFKEFSNRRSVWTISTESCREAHFATFPTALVKPCIMAGTSERGCCAECGAPWMRIVERVREPSRPGNDSKVTGVTLVDGNRDPQRHVSRTVGQTWVPGCKCGAPTMPCTVFDPFSGSGTTASVATALGRRGIGTELSRDYIDIARRRVEAIYSKISKRPKRPKRPRPDPFAWELFAEVAA